MYTCKKLNMFMMFLSKNIYISDINHQHYFWSQISVYEEKTQKKHKTKPLK